MDKGPSSYRRWGKRGWDIIFSFLVLIVFSPLILCLAILVAIVLGCPVLFRQNRPGLNEKPFTLFKFRSMKDLHAPDGELLPDTERLTKFGKFLRRTSLDELPEIFNVLEGDMSLVGPRPLLMQYLPLYSPEQKRRHEVKPGITGWAQVNGRNAISWEEKFELDVWYVEHQSFLLDIKILILTMIEVFKREGISQAGHATIEEFQGTMPKR